MTGLLIFSLILITLHIFSLRTILKTDNEEAITESLKKIEDLTSTDENNKRISFNLIFPLLVIIILSLVEIGYFIFVVYILKDYVIILGASILVGYDIYALIKFFPKLGLFIKNPVGYFKEKTDAFDNILNSTVAVLEILFCIYVVVKIFMKYNF